MSANFLTLPRELRDKIYELCLLVEKPIHPFGISQLRRDLSPGILGVNKAISHEARLVLYRNSFEFISTSSEDCIRHIYIDFPSLRDLELGNVTIEEDSARTLAIIKNSCTNLKTLRMYRDSTNDIKLKLDSLDNPKIAAEAFALVDTRLRAISSLQDIIVEVYEEAPSDYIRRQIMNHGWTISAAKNVEERRDDSDDNWDGYDDYEWDFYEDFDDNHDNYHYEYDSDFWRRAAD